MHTYILTNTFDFIHINVQGLHIWVTETCYDASLKVFRQLDQGDILEVYEKELHCSGYKQYVKVKDFECCVFRESSASSLVAVTKLTCWLI